MILSCTALKTPGVLLSAFSTPICVSLIRMGVASRLRMGVPRYPRSGAYFKEYGASRTSETLKCPVANEALACQRCGDRHALPDHGL